MSRLPRVAVVGATGAVGRELLQLFNERNFQYAELALVASPRSEGTTVLFRDKQHVVHNLEKFVFTNTDIAFFSAGTGISKVWAARAAAQGALVIDNTNAFRMDPLSPLLVPQVNGGLLAQRPQNGIIANPNCSTIQMVRVLEPIRQQFGLTRVIASTYQAASGGGLTGMDELRAGAHAVLAGGTAPHQRFPQPLAFNVVPQVDVLLENGFTLEEQKMVQETRKILGLPDLHVTATCVRVPVLNCHSEAVYVETERELDRAGILAALGAAPELDVYPSQMESHYPTPATLTNQNTVHVGRIRIDPMNPRAAWFWIVADNLRIGAALNAIQIAEEWLRVRAVGGIAA